MTTPNGSQPGTDYIHWLPAQRMARMALRLGLRLVARVSVEGIENVPMTGPLIIVINHLHLIDTAVAIAVLPRRGVPYVNAKWKRTPVAWVLAPLGGAIYRDNVDTRAFRASLEVLRAGGVLGIAPEGTRSHTGALGPGQPGAARLASRSSAPILPLVMYGQEKASTYWKRLRRVPICVRIGPVFQIPHGNADKAQLTHYTTEIMVALARMLPPAYRGNYATLETTMNVPSGHSE